MAWFKVSDDKWYLEVVADDSVEDDGKEKPKIICCVDVSGSMSGAPIENVYNVISEIYECTGIPYPVFCYHGTVVKTDMKKVSQNGLYAGGWTDFSVVFDAMRDELVKNMVNTTFIFMTDGNHTQGQEKLTKSIEAFKLVMSMAPKHVKVTIHVIGFGSVSNSFLENIRKLGNKEGLFRYSTESIDLGNDFNEMFDYASARECTVKVNDKTFETMSNSKQVGFLLSEDLSKFDTVMVKLGNTDAWKEIPVQELPSENVSPLYRIKAINKIVPTNEQEVKGILVQLNNVPSYGHNMTISEKMEVEQMKRDLSARMMEYIGLFTQIKMGQVEVECVETCRQIFRHRPSKKIGPASQQERGVFSKDGHCRNIGWVQAGHYGERLERTRTILLAALRYFGEKRLRNHEGECGRYSLPRSVGRTRCVCDRLAGCRLEAVADSGCHGVFRTVHTGDGYVSPSRRI